MDTRNEFEIVPHNRIRNFRLFLVQQVYRTPHLHRDMEIFLLIDGELTLYAGHQTALLHSGDILLLKPYLIHELRAKSKVLILSMQVSSAFFSDYFPQINTIEPEQTVLPASDSEAARKIKYEMTDLAFNYIKKEKGYELKCAGLINLIFFDLLHAVPWRTITESDHAVNKLKESRIRELTSYIDANYASKILLSELAERVNLSMYYLSHFFKDNFGMTFQEYLSRIRCEKARQLLTDTDQSLLEISMQCGFSDMKYFKRYFTKQYGRSPAEYRKLCTSPDPSEEKGSVPTTEEILTDAQSLKVLEKYRARFFRVP